MKKFGWHNEYAQYPLEDYQMKKMKVMMLAAAMLMGSAALRAEVLEGVVTDTMCGLSHSGKPADKCTAGCVKNGSGISLIVGDKLYALKGKVTGLETMGGAKVKVTGKVTGTEVAVDSFAK